MIEQIIPGNRTKYNIIKTIYENPKINISSIIKKTSASPNLVIKYINMLSKMNLIIDEKFSGNKKTHLRNISPIFNSEMSKCLYSLIEISKKIEFYHKYQKLAKYFSQIEQIIDVKDSIILVYGSYSRLSADNSSDLDILIVSKFKKQELDRIKEVFVTFDKEISIKVESPSKFVANIKKPLYQNILREHIIIVGVFFYLEILSDKIQLV